MALNLVDLKSAISFWREKNHISSKLRLLSYYLMYSSHLRSFPFWIFRRKTHFDECVSTQIKVIHSMKEERESIKNCRLWILLGYRMITMTSVMQSTCSKVSFDIMNISLWMAFPIWFFFLLAELNFSTLRESSFTLDRFAFHSFHFGIPHESEQQPTFCGKRAKEREAAVTVFYSAKN